MIKDLAEAPTETENSALWRDSKELPSARDHFDQIVEQALAKQLAVFLDFDGTLTGVADRPDQAELSDAMRATVKRLARRVTVSIISGRDLKDLRQRIGLPDIFYAGSHGFEIAGPGGPEVIFQKGQLFLPELAQAEHELRARASLITGALVERKRFSIAVHYRKTPEDLTENLRATVEQIHARFPRLRKIAGKKVLELQPNIDWHKGKALHWILDRLRLNGLDPLPLYMGDDVTDENAFHSLLGRGIGIVVGDQSRPTQANYALKSPEEVKEFLLSLIVQLAKS